MSSLFLINSIQTSIRYVHSILKIWKKLNIFQLNCKRIFQSQKFGHHGPSSPQKPPSHKFSLAKPLNQTKVIHESASNPGQTSPFGIKTTGKHTFCNSLLSPCMCNNTKCCGALSGGSFYNCAHATGLYIFEGIGIPKKPCSKTQCAEGVCMIISVLSAHGAKEYEDRQCCKGSAFSQVTCSEGINCQQRNKNGSFTICCDPSCVGALWIFYFYLCLWIN